MSQTAKYNNSWSKANSHITYVKHIIFLEQFTMISDQDVSVIHARINQSGAGYKGSGTLGGAMIEYCTQMLVPCHSLLFVVKL